MAKVSAGAAAMTIRTDDQTAKGFQSAKRNLKDFNDTMQSVKGQLLPVSEFLKGGMFAGGAMMGAGAILTDFQSLGDAVGLLTGKLPDMSAEMGKAGGATRELGAEAESAGNMLTRLGGYVTAASATGYAMVEAYTKVAPTLSTVRDTISGGVGSFNEWIANAQNLANAQAEAVANHAQAVDASVFALMDLGAAQNEVQAASDALAVAQQAAAFASLDFEHAQAALAAATTPAAQATAEAAVMTQQLAVEQAAGAVAAAEAALAAAQEAVAAQGATVARTEQAVAETAALAPTVQLTAAEHLLAAAGIQNATASQLAAAQTLLMSNTEAGAVTVKALYTKMTNLNVGAKLRDAGASLLSAARDRIATVAKGGLTMATIRQSMAANAASLKNIFLTLTLGAVGIATKACTLAWATLTTVMAANPIGAILIALTALVAIVGGLVRWFNSSSKAADKNSEALQRNAEAAKANTDAHEKNRKKWDEFAKVDNLRLERLRQLSEVQDKSDAQMQESARLVEELNDAVGGMGLTFDETTGAVGGLHDGLEDMLKNGQLNRRIGQLKAEYQALTKELLEEGTTAERKEEIEQRKMTINRQLTHYEEGGTTDIMGKSERQALKDITESYKKSAKERTDAEKKELEERGKIIKEIDETHKKALDEIATLEADIRKHSQNALENELDTLNEKVNKRREELLLAIQAKQALGEASDAEREALGRLADLQSQRQEQIREKYRQEAAKFLTDFEGEEAERGFKNEQSAEEKRLSKLMDTNPFEAFTSIGADLAGAKDALAASRQNVMDTMKAAGADGVVDDAEKKRIENAKKEYQRTQQIQERLLTAQEKAQDKIRSGVEAAMKEQGDAGSPLSALQAGTADAQQKFIENQMNAKSPEALATEELVALVKAKYDQERLDKDKVEKAVLELSSKIEGSI